MITESGGMCEIIRFDDVSRFYGDILGINRVNLGIEAGITGLVGPNGSGKSTLMNLMAGLLRPSRGTISVLGFSPGREALFRLLGYCTQYDSFPLGMTGRRFITSYLKIHGFDSTQACELADRALERVSLTDAADRGIDGYSKGMRQRIKLAQAISHEPRVLILDEPLNGLDPMARAEVIELFREFSRAGAHVLVSSHILHEVDLIADNVVLLDNGYVVAEGEVEGIHGELKQHPTVISIRSAGASSIAARMFEIQGVIEARLHDDNDGLYVRTLDADVFYLAFNRLVRTQGWHVESIGPADEAVAAMYQHLVVDEPLSP